MKILWEECGALQVYDLCMLAWLDISYCGTWNDMTHDRQCRCHGQSVFSSVLVLAVITKYNGWVANKQQTFISPGSRGWKSEIRVPGHLSSGEGSLPGCRLRAFLLSSCGQEQRGGNVGSLRTLKKSTHPSQGLHPYDLT